MFEHNASGFRVVDVLVMAGGSGRRLGLNVEKPMAPLLGRPMVGWVIHSACASGCARRIYVCTSPNTPKTTRYAERIGLDVCIGSGKDYVEDLAYALRTLKLGVTLVLPSDTPLIKPSTLRALVHKYFEEEAELLALATPRHALEELGLGPQYTMEVGGDEVCLAGVFVLDASKINLEGGRLLAEKYFVWREATELLNVNTKLEMDFAEKCLRFEKRLEGLDGGVRLG